MPTHHPKVIFITGTSSGFGFLTAVHLSQRGYRVIATMRDLKKQGQLLNKITGIKSSVDILALDVIDKISIQRAVEETVRKHGRIDVVVNNAGYGIGGFFEDLTDHEIRAQMDTNFFGVQNVCREIIPVMREQKGGKIINISSVSGFSTSPAFGAYNTSKWALEGFSEGLHYELKPFGIEVFLIEPGTYKTKIFYDNVRYAKKFDDPQSPYYARSQFFKKKVMNYVDNCRKDPNRVALLIEKLIEAKNPAFRNIPDLESRTLFLLRKFLPFRAYQWIIQTALDAGFKKKI